MSQQLLFPANLEELRQHDSIQRKNYKDLIKELSERTEEKKDAVNEEQLKFNEFQKQIALHAINSRSGKPIAPKVKTLLDFKYFHFIDI